MFYKSLKSALLLYIIFHYTPLAAQVDSLSTNIEFKTILESEKVPLNKEVIYHIELSWKGDLDRYQIAEIIEPGISGLDLRGSGSSNKLSSDKNGNPHSIRRVTYYFSPQSVGMAYIDGLTIQYKDNLTGKVETLIAQRIAVKIIEPLPEENGVSAFGTFFQLFLLIIFILVITYFGFRFLQRRSTKAVEEESVKTLEEKYLDIMKETIHLANNVSKENISALSKLLSSYVAEKFSISGNPGTPEIKEKLAELEITEDVIGKIGIMIEKAELARFAAEEISPSELHLFYDSIENILKEIDNKEKTKAGKQELL